MLGQWSRPDPQQDYRKDPFQQKRKKQLKRTKLEFNLWPSHTCTTIHPHKHVLTSTYICIWNYYCLQVGSVGEGACHHAR